MSVIKKLFQKNRQFLTILFLAALFLFTGVTLSRQAVMTAAHTSDDWGLSFGENNAPPRGNASAEELIKNNAYFIGDISQSVIYLTFDAGYENGYTGKILDVLAEHEVKAAFFVVSHYIKTNPELIKRMADEGHTVANHTSSHPDMSKISDGTAFSEELAPVEQLYAEITGEEMKKYYRPPQGKYSVKNLETAAELGYTTFFWSLAYADWDNSSQPTREYALNKLNSRIHNGAVVLLHSTSQTNAEILDELLTGWKEKGYTFGTLDGLCAK